MGNNGRVTRPASTRAARLDQVCAAAVEVARAGITEVDADDVGDHLQVVAEGDRLVTHYFECRLAGYRGWRWAVTVTRVPRSKHGHHLRDGAAARPGRAARARAGCPGRSGSSRATWARATCCRPRRTTIGWPPVTCSPTTRRSRRPPGSWASGGARVLSREGRIDTAQRWYDGDHGPAAPISTAAPAAARCGTCGFYLPLAGAMRQAFGACGNFYAPDDGRVVSADHGCGAHSETLIEAAETAGRGAADGVRRQRGRGHVGQPGPGLGGGRRAGGAVRALLIVRAGVLRRGGQLDLARRRRRLASCRIITARPGKAPAGNRPGRSRASSGDRGRSASPGRRSAGPARPPPSAINPARANGTIGGSSGSGRGGCSLGTRQAYGDLLSLPADDLGRCARQLEDHLRGPDGQ